MSKTINPAIVRNALGLIGSQACTVVFLKKDGTEKSVNGFLRPSSRFVGNAKGQAQGEAMKARGQVFIGYATAKDDKGKPKSASFYEDRVTEIRGAGVHIKAKG